MPLSPVLPDAQSEQREKEKRQKDKQEAHLYCHIRVATDADIAQQVGSTQWFDLVDYDKLPPNRTFRVRKLTPFADFKQQVRGLMLVLAVLVARWLEGTPGSLLYQGPHPFH